MKQANINVERGRDTPKPVQNCATDICRRPLRFPLRLHGRNHCRPRHYRQYRPRPSAFPLRFLCEACNHAGRLHCRKPGKTAPALCFTNSHIAHPLAVDGQSIPQRGIVLPMYTIAETDRFKKKAATLAGKPSPARRRNPQWRRPAQSALAYGGERQTGWCARDLLQPAG